MEDLSLTHLLLFEFGFSLFCLGANGHQIKTRRWTSPAISQPAIKLARGSVLTLPIWQLKIKFPFTLNSKEWLIWAHSASRLNQKNQQQFLHQEDFVPVVSLFCTTLGGVTWMLQNIERGVRSKVGFPADPFDKDLPENDQGAVWPLTFWAWPANN